MFIKQLTIIIAAAFLAIPATASAKGKAAGKAKTKAGKASKKVIKTEEKAPKRSIADCIKKCRQQGLGPETGSILKVTSQALGLLSTGESFSQKANLDIDMQVDVLQAYARNRAMYCESLDIMNPQYMKNYSANTDVLFLEAMEGGLLNVFLCEYYLRTKDETILPGIKALSNYLALGVSGIGTWGYAMPNVKKDGLYGKAKGIPYSEEESGTNNYCTAVIATSLALAQKCGAKAKPIQTAIDMAKDYMSYYVNKGGIPGSSVHLPNTFGHNGDNRSGYAAIFFHLIGDKDSARYFARLALADDGKPARFTTKWDDDADRLLELCRSKKALVITGKEGDPTSLLSEDEVKESIATAGFKAKTATDEKLLAALKSWSPVVRAQAAKALGSREHDLTGNLVSMLKSNDIMSRYAAAAAFRYGQRPMEILPILVQILQKESDETLLDYAIDAISIRRSKGETQEWKDAVRKATPAIIDVVTRNYPGKDRYGRIAAHLAENLGRQRHRDEFSPFFGHGSETVEGIEKYVPIEKRIELAKALLNNHYGSARIVGLQICDSMSDKEAEKLYEEMYYAVKTVAPGTGINDWGLKHMGYSSLAKKRFKEVIDWSLEFVEIDDRGRHRRGMRALSYFSYKNLEPYWPRIEIVLKPLLAMPGHSGHRLKYLQKWQRFFKNKDKVIELRSIEPFLTEAGKKAHRPLFPKDVQ